MFCVVDLVAVFGCKRFTCTLSFDDFELAPNFTRYRRDIGGSYLAGLRYFVEKCAGRARKGPLCTFD